jgi:hypothetical protein
MRARRVIESKQSGPDRPVAADGLRALRTGQEGPVPSQAGALPMPRPGRFSFSCVIVLAALALLAGPGGAARAQEPAAKKKDAPPEIPAVPPPAEDTNPDRFAKDPTKLERWTPLELWDAVDYLVRTEQPARAARFLDAFLARKPDAATLLSIRDQYGVESILRLQDYPQTAPQALPLLNRLAEASRGEVAEPSRLRRYVAALAASPEEQDFAVERLREARAAAVPPLLQALADKGLAPAARARLIAGLGRLERTAVPPLLAALDAPDESVSSAAAEALGRLGDRRAVPDLTYHAARRDAPAALRDASRNAVARLTGRPFAAQPRPPARVLADEARSYLEHRVEFPDGPFEVWAWEQDAPAPQRATPAQAELLFGRKYVREALALDPKDPEARAVQVALGLREAAGADKAEAPPEADPAVLARVLRSAMARGDAEVGAAAARALGRLTKAEDLAAEGERHPLVEALAAHSRRIRFAAARALVEVDPRRPFAGSSGVVPVLAEFAAVGPLPRAIIVDGNELRANLVGSVLKSLGYDPRTTADAEQGFRLAAATADVELVVAEPGALQGAWSTRDLLANLRADARTAALPIFLIQPADLGAAARRAAQLVDQAEVEPNDLASQANYIAFTSPPRQARVRGLLPGNDPLGDVFILGPLARGDGINLAVSFQAFSTLKPEDVVLTIERRNDDGTTATPLVRRLGRMAYSVPSDGFYYVRVETYPRRRGNLAGYVLEVLMRELNPTPVGTATQQRLAELVAQFPRVVVLLAPDDVDFLRRQISRARERLGPRPLSDAERASYAKLSAELLARIGEHRDSPFWPDLAVAGPALAMDEVPAAEAALADLPSVDAQRNLADTLLDPVKPAANRKAAGEGLVRSIRRFGPLLTAAQERRLAAASADEPDPALRSAVEAAITALRPDGRRAPTAAPPTPTPAPTPGPGGPP